MHQYQNILATLMTRHRNKLQIHPQSYSPEHILSPYRARHMSPDISNPPTSKLPPELFRTIISNLNVHADRSTLCNVALSSKLLASESQRVLFRTTTDSFWKRNSLRRHFIYLSAIIAAPTRLGPLVHAYTQTGLSLAMNNVESETPGPGTVPLIIIPQMHTDLFTSSA